MDWLREMLSRCAGLLRRKRLDHNLDEELEAHLELAVQENVRRGMSEADARTAALRVFGDVTQIKETYRTQRGIPFLETLAQDIRYATRRLRASPGFTLVAVVTLALGIGANTAIFTLVQGILLRSLPVTDPSHLYRIGDRIDCCYYNSFENDDGDFDLFSYDLYLHFKQGAPEFVQLAAVEAGGSGYSVRTGAAPPRPLRSEFVSGNYFATLGVGAYAGRPLTERDDVPGAAPVVVLSYQAWETQFARDPAIVGSTVYIQTHPFTVAGIAPPGFFGDRVISIPPDFWMPLAAETILEGANSSVRQPESLWLYAIGRLRPDTNLSALQTKLSVLLRQWMGTRPGFTANGGAALIPRQHVVLSRAGGGIQKLQHQTGASLRMLMILAGVVLLIACANLANLLLARGTARRGDVAVRMALGATRSRLVRQIVTESLLLSLMGGVAGLAVAYFGCHMILSLAFPEARNMPVAASPSLAVVGFALLVSLLTGVVFGTAPAWVSSHAQPAEAFRGTSRFTRDRASVWQRTLVVFQLALSVVLIAGTLLITKSLLNLEQQNFGFSTAHRYVLSTDLQGAGYTIDRLPEFYREVEERFSAVPGLADISFARYIPLGGNQWGGCVTLQGHGAPRPGERCFSDWDRVSWCFLGTLGVPMVRGRNFTAGDTATSGQVVLVNQAFVKQFFPDKDPIGQRFGLDGQEYSSVFQIVGVFADFKLTNVRAEARPLFLRVLPQQLTGLKDPERTAAERHSMYLDQVILNFTVPPQDAEALVRKTMAQVDPNLPVFHLAPYDAVLGENFSQDRLIARLTFAFGLLALLLASVGLYGMMSYFVARRTGEIGIRMAIGASRSQIVQMVLRGALLQLIAGLAFGIPASLFAGRLIARLLYHVSGFDPLALAGSAAVLAICAGIAAFVPAIRAASIDPMRALRTE